MPKSDLMNVCTDDAICFSILLTGDKNRLSLLRLLDGGVGDNDVDNLLRGGVLLVVLC